MKLKQKDLKDLANKINEIAELDGEDQIDPSQSYDDLHQDLVNAVAGSEDTENNEPEVEILSDDKSEFSDHQWNILAELGCPAATEEPEEEEEGSEDEDEGDEEEEEEGEDEEEEEEGEAETPSEEDINSMKKKDLQQVIEDHELDVDPNQKVSELREAIVDALHGEEEEEEEEPEEEEAEEGVTYEDLEKMTKKKDLKTVIEEYELDLDASKYKKVDDLREAIAEALELVEPEEEEEESEEEEEEEGLTLEDLNNMTKKNELKQVIKDNDLDIDASEYKKVNDLREAIADALDLTDEEEEEEEEEPEVPAFDDIMAMAKKDLKEVIEEHELDVDPDDHKKAELQKAVAKALGYKVEEKKSKQKADSKEKGKKGEKKESKVKKVAELLMEGTRTPKELVEESENRGLSVSTMRSAISHCKKEDQLNRYGMPEVIVKDEDTNIIMLKSDYDKKKKKSSSSKGKSSGKKSGTKKKK